MKQMLKHKTLGCCFFLFLVSHCSTNELQEWTPADHGTASLDSQQAPQPAEKKEKAQSSLLMWSASCASCHGFDGRGRGKQTPPGVAMPNFTDPAWQKKKTEEQILHAIRMGKGMMPGFANRIPDDSIRALAQHVRSFGKEAL